MFARLGLVLPLVLLVPTLVFAGGGKEEPAVQQSNGRSSVQVDENWGFSWRFIEDSIEFTVSAPTTGWIGIGFDPSRMMKDADYILAYVDNGTVYARDDWGTGNTSHGPDTGQGGTDNVTAISGAESDGVTTVTFSVPLDSGDRYDKTFAPGKSHTVLLAYGAEGADNFTGMHRKRTSIEVVLE